MQSSHKQQPFVAAADVTSQQGDVGVDAGTSPVAAISRKLNAQPNRQQHRIYTSTPKNQFNKLQQQQKQSQQRNNAIGFCSLAKATTKQYICAGGAAAGEGQAAIFDVRLKALLLLFGIIIIGYRIISLTMPYINSSSSSVQQLSSYVQAQLNSAWNWSEEHQLRSKLSPLLCGLLMAIFSYGIVYMDSAVPGIRPAAPFSPRSKERNRERRTALHLNYLCALSAGVMVTVLMYADF